MAITRRKASSLTEGRQTQAGEPKLRKLKLTKETVKLLASKKPPGCVRTASKLICVALTDFSDVCKGHTPKIAHKPRTARCRY